MRLTRAWLTLCGLAFGMFLIFAVAFAMASLAIVADAALWAFDAPMRVVRFSRRPGLPPGKR